MNIRFNTDTIRPMTEWLMKRKHQDIRDEAGLREILKMPDYEVEFQRYSEPGLPDCGINFEEAVDFFMNFDRKDFDNPRLQYKKDSFAAVIPARQQKEAAGPEGPAALAIVIGFSSGNDLLTAAVRDSDSGARFPGSRGTYPPRSAGG